MKDTVSAAKVVTDYLQRLSVQISLSQIMSMLDTPVGNSMRGISDALDQLGVPHEVYQLPAEYLERLEAPFLTIMRIEKEPFCLVEALDAEYVTLSTHKRTPVRLHKANFLQFWTGVVLLAEKNEQTFADRWYSWKDRWFHLTSSFLPMCMGLLLLGLIAGCAPFYPFSWQGTGLFAFLTLGISVSVAILYKEYVNPDFLQRFCKRGKQVDCNQVLHSGGARLPGGVTLGEAGLVFFLSCLVFILYMPERYLFPMQCILSIAFLVTLYSVYYQVWVLHKICNLCMVVNISIWSLMVVLWRSVSYITLSIEAGLPFLIFAGIFLLVAYGWSGIRKLLLVRGDGLRFKAFRSALVQDTELFRLMMERQPTLPVEYINCALTNNNSASETTLLWVTHPHCEHCARLHTIIHRMQDRLNIQLIFHVDPSDEKAFAVIQQITECYLNVGWKESMHLLEKWYQNRKLESPITPSSRTMDTLRKHSNLCRSLGIQGTPAVFIHGKPYPDIYQFEDLEYLL